MYFINEQLGVMKLGDGLFIDMVRETARNYPEIKYEEK